MSLPKPSGSDLKSLSLFAPFQEAKPPSKKPQRDDRVSGNFQLTKTTQKTFLAFCTFKVSSAVAAAAAVGSKLINHEISDKPENKSRNISSSLALSLSFGAKQNSICINIFQSKPENKRKRERERLLRLHLYSLYCVDYEIGSAEGKRQQREKDLSWQ